MNIKKLQKILKTVKAYYILLTTGWHNLDLIPPNKRVEVMDVNGNTAFADPTYYPFEVKHFAGDEKNPWGWRGTPVFYGNGIEKWDGGWMVVCDGLGSNIDSKIILWRECS
jgi:hypothetical protein